MLGGTWNQRAELSTNYLSTKIKAKYKFQTIFKIYSPETRREAFDIFQIHDGRRGYSPPLKVEITSVGQIKLIGEYQIGGLTSDICVKNILQDSDYGLSRKTIQRDGTEYTLDVFLTFDGMGGYKAEAFLDGVLEAKGTYSPQENNGYFKSPKYFFKHGSYSKNIFEYELKSKFKMFKIN